MDEKDDIRRAGSPDAEAPDTQNATETPTAHSQEEVEEPIRLSCGTVLDDIPEVSEKSSQSASLRAPNSQQGSRPPTRHLNTSASYASVVGSAREAQTAELPHLKRKYTKLANKESHPMEHLGITLGLPAIAFCDLILPCIIYYALIHQKQAQWQRDCGDPRSRSASCPSDKPQFDKDILGYAVVCFGFGELWVLLARVHRLFFHREQCAPLLSRNRWELDATSWVYAVAMIMALIPFTVGSTMVIPKLYLYGPAFLMVFLGAIMVVTTLLPFNIPIGINSHARGTSLRPFIYYAAEDFIAVDGLQDREFRVRYNERYESNKAFRRMFVYLTLWWELGIVVYVGCLSAVIWILEFQVAFGLSLGILFSYIAIWAAGSYVYVHFEMDRQRKAYESGKASV